MEVLKKIFLFIIATIPFCGNVSAKHIIGGEMYYTYLGNGTAPNTDKYRVTLRLFRDDFAPLDAAQMPADVYIGIFDNDTGGQINSGIPWDVFNSDIEPVKVNPFPVCMVNRPNIGYHAATYSFEVDLPRNNKGYTATYQTCCRITPINNILNGPSGEGSTFSCVIPAIIGQLPDNSPRFESTIDAICGGKRFSLQFGAQDADGDSLTYAFVSAYNGGTAKGAQNINPSPPPYGSVNYVGNFSGTRPLGLQASIDRQTGTISGVAPANGRYVVTVLVASWRDGKQIAEHRKDFIINVTNCDFANALLLQKDSQCDGFTVGFSNDDVSSLNKTFYWEFYDAQHNLLDTSTAAQPQITFPAAGDYNYKLVVNRGDQCADSAQASIGVYPGFFPDFSMDGKCVNSQILFQDHSAANYGTVNFWHWDFGETGSPVDTSNLKNPGYTYTRPDSYDVSMIVQSSVGCRDTVVKTLDIQEKPFFSITNDTLICNIDQLQLTASVDDPGKGAITWSPAYNINDIHSFNPVMTPKHTTTYFAHYQESRGCETTDSVTVRVVEKVSLKMPADTTICLTDSVFLHAETDGLKFLWSPAGELGASTSNDIWVSPSASTTYTLLSMIGNCTATGDIHVKTVPYPAAKAVADTAICLGDAVQLSATGGSSYDWEPKIFLDKGDIPGPLVTPSRTTQYVVKVNDVLGCPKPGFDTVTVRVIQPYVQVEPSDTSVVVGEPLQLHASANGSDILWTPSAGLNDPSIPDPIALPAQDQRYVVRVITDGGCVAYDTISVKVFQLKPGFYIPNAFTPNQDRLNDALRPIGIGLRSLTYFRIYNRLGQLVFSTNSFRDGWDGTYKGSPQDPAIYAWEASAVDYMGKVVKAKGSITLIR